MDAKKADVVFLVGGMSCQGCVESVKRVIGRVPGVAVKQVELGKAVVLMEPDAAAVARVETALGKAGYEAKRQGA